VENLIFSLDQWFENRPRYHHIMQTYGEAKEDWDRHDTYDNAVAAIYLVKRGKLAIAKTLLDALAQSLYGIGAATGESIDTTTLPSQPPSFRLLVASISSNGNDAGTDMGNNAFLGMAFAKYASATNERCYATIARDILAAIDISTGCPSSAWKGWKRRLPAGGEHDARSVEHAIDIAALARMVGDTSAASNAATFIAHTYDPVEQKYTAGTGSGCNNNQRSTWCECVISDTAVWNAAADGDSANPSHLAAAMKKTIDVSHTTDEKDGYTYSGVRFSSKGSGIQWEVTASTVLAWDHFITTYPNNVDATMHEMYLSKISGYRASIMHMIESYGYMWASVNQQGFSDTGLGWKYFTRSHTVASAWAGLMLLHSNGTARLAASANSYAKDAPGLPA
jgi:hypothetical protein